MPIPTNEELALALNLLQEAKAKLKRVQLYLSNDTSIDKHVSKSYRHVKKAMRKLNEEIE